MALRGALTEAHLGGAGEMSALSWEISTAAHRVPPRIALKRAVFLAFTGSTVFAPISVDLVLKANLQVDLIFLPK